MTKHQAPGTKHPLTGPIRRPRSGGKPKQLVILLHGWGADGPNLIDLGDAFASWLPDAQFIAPNAPHPCEANPYGYQWFSLMDRQPQHMLTGVRDAAEVVNKFIDEQLAQLSPSPSGRGWREAPDEGGGTQKDPLPNPPPQAGEGIKVALVGFSQGTMVGLQVALRRAPSIAALVGFSGALIAPDTLAKEIAARPPICLIHGQADEVVPFRSLKTASDALAACGVPVESHARPFLGHSIDMEGIKIAGEFLKKAVED